MPRFSPRRPLGRTGFVATILGAGDLADASLPFDDCTATLRRALDAGVNVVDTAPMYEDGLSERIVGAAVRDRRGGVFVVDKIDALDEPVGPQVDASLARLGLPFVDAFVFHAVNDVARWNTLQRTGALRAVDAVVRAGKARFRGISCHHPDACVAALRSGWCDVLSFPLGPFVDRRYEDDVLPLARSLGVGTICFKTFGAGMLVADTDGYGKPATGDVGPPLTVDDCVRYTLSLDPDVALLGLSNAAEQDAAFAALERATPMDEAERADVRQRAAARIAARPTWWNPAA